MSKKKEFSDLVKEANDALVNQKEAKRLEDAQMILELQNRQKALIQLLVKNDPKRLANIKNEE